MKTEAEQHNAVGAYVPKVMRKSMLKSTMCHEGVGFAFVIALLALALPVCSVDPFGVFF